jgi:hypothetical protein
VPIFSGFETTYRVRSAEAQLDVRAAQRDRLRNQVALDVWKAYQNLNTASQSLTATSDLVASAEQSERVALGRYKAGVGTVLDLLTARPPRQCSPATHSGRPRLACLSRLLAQRSVRWIHAAATGSARKTMNLKSPIAPAHASTLAVQGYSHERAFPILIGGTPFVLSSPRSAYQL